MTTEKELNDRIQKVLASGAGERLTAKELESVIDFARSAKEIFLQADATGNENIRRRGIAVATKALDMVEESAPSRPLPAKPRGQPPTSSIRGSGHVSIKDAIDHWIQLAERGQRPTRADWKILGFDRQ